VREVIGSVEYATVEIGTNTRPRPRPWITPVVTAGAFSSVFAV
jgi:hypothetical protein